MIPLLDSVNYNAINVTQQNDGISISEICIIFTYYFQIVENEFLFAEKTFLSKDGDVPLGSPSYHHRGGSTG